MKSTLMKTITIVALLLSAAVAGHATVYRVTTTESGYGQDWDHPCSLSYALTHATSGDEVWVKGYTDSTTYTNVHIHAVNGVNVEGCYTGNINDDGQRDIVNLVSVLSGTSSDCVIEVPNTVTNTSGTVLEYLTIKSGHGHTGSEGYKYGGGIYCEGSPTISHCTISNNYAQFGAGIYAASGTTPSIHDSMITYNSDGYYVSGGEYGMGVYMYGGQCCDNVITHNIFAVTGGASHSGAGVYIGSYANPTFTGNTIEYNGNSGRSSSNGGGVYASSCSSSLVVSNNHINYNYAYYGGGIYWASPGRIQGNTAITHNTYNNTTSSGYGGGIYLTSSGALENNTITDNTIANGGGVYYSGTGAISRNTIKTNTAGSGGGIYWAATSSNTGTIYSNAIASNTATTGGGLYVNTMQSTSVFYNNTVTDHSSGSNIHLNNPSGGVIKNCIISAGNPNGINANSSSYSVVHDCFYGNEEDDYYGSPTTNDCITQYPDLDGNYHIPDDSPCVDAGDDSGVGSGWLDIDGEPRQVDIPDVRDTGTKVDIGADEYYPDYTTSPMVDQGLPTSSLNEAAGANRCNFRWADASSFDIGYGDSFQFYSGPSWVIDEVVVWIVPDVPVWPSYYLGDYYSDVRLHVGTGSLTPTASGDFSTGSNTISNISPSGAAITAVTADYGSSTNYECSDGTFNQIWKITFSNLSKTIAADSTVYFGIIGAPRVDRLWFNHATHGLADGTIRKFDTTNLSSTTAVSGIGWFGKDADINIQVFAHPQ